MSRSSILGSCVQGASHIRTGTACQDSKKSNLLDDGTIILAVADGHGSKACPYSKTGSRIAVNVFVKVMEDFHDRYSDNPELLLTFLNREGDTKVAQAIDAQWKRRVLKAHTDNKRKTFFDENGEKIQEDIYLLYGTTLIGLMIMPSFLFAFQLGDGDIIYVNSNGVSHVLQSERILGTETHSLSKQDSWKRAISSVRRMESDDHLPFVFMLATDGFPNSHKNEYEFLRTCSDYFQMIRSSGIQAVKENMRSWLAETSEMGCGDDITLLMAYFDSNTDEEQPSTGMQQAAKHKAPVADDGKSELLIGSEANENAPSE